MASAIRLMPGLDEVVNTISPVAAAPKIMLLAASSLSACRKVPFTSGIRRERYSATSDWGVMG